MSPQIKDLKMIKVTCQFCGEVNFLDLPAKENNKNQTLSWQADFENARCKKCGRRFGDAIEEEGKTSNQEIRGICRLVAALVANAFDTEKETAKIIRPYLENYPKPFHILPYFSKRTQARIKKALARRKKLWESLIEKDPPWWITNYEECFEYDANQILKRLRNKILKLSCEEIEEWMKAKPAKIKKQHG